MKTVTLYTRPGCHLCDDARAALQALRTRHEFEIREVDIETDDALHAAYLERIPVICLDGEHVSDYFLDEPTLTARLNSDG
jgi:glutaredoxin